MGNISDWLEIKYGETIPFTLKETGHSDPAIKQTAFQFQSSGDAVIARLQFYDTNDRNSVTDRFILIQESDGELTIEFPDVEDGRKTVNSDQLNGRSCIWTVKINENWDHYYIACDETEVYSLGPADISNSVWDKAKGMESINELEFAQGITKWRYAGCYQVPQN